MRAKFINENINTFNIVNNIIKYLLDIYDLKSYKDFIDDQELGDCQEIVNMIKSEFPTLVKKIVGEIKIDEPYIDENGNKQILMIHHWIEINNTYYDFSKGTLIYHIDMDSYELYEPEVIDDYRYKEIYRN